MDLGERDDTPLHVAAANCNLDSVVTLLRNGANVEASNSLGWTPLMQASRYGHECIVSILLKHGADIEKRNKYGLTALMLASASGNVEVVRLLLEKGSTLNPELNILICQVSPLMIASLFSSNEVVRIYLDRGINPNILSPKTEISAIMFAAGGGNVSTVKRLIERGAQVNSTNCGGYSVLDAATISNNVEVMNYLKTHSTLKLKKKGDKITDIMEVTRLGDFSALQNMLYEDPSKAKSVTGEGQTPLMVASMLNHKSIAELLLQHGANVDAQDYVNQWTALMQAIYYRHTAMVLFLLNHGADLNIETNLGYNAFTLANEVMDIDVLKIVYNFQEPAINNPSMNAWSNESTPKNESNTYTTLQSIKKNILSKIPTWNISYLKSTENTTKRTSHSERRSSYSPSIQSNDSIYTEISEENQLFYTNVFSEMKKVETNFFDSMKPPSIRRKGVKAMPPGVKINDKSIADKELSSTKEREESAKFRDIPDIRVKGTSMTTDSNQGPKSGFDQVAELLEKLSMKSCVTDFEREEVDMEALKMLGSTDFKDLGVYKSKVDKILKAIEDMNKI